MSRSYKNTVIAVLLACILTMAIGYAVLNTRLNISGISNITSNFDIQVTGISEFQTFQLAETLNMDFTPTSATYSTNLQAPGDTGFYEIVVENKGNIDGYVYFNTDEWGYNNYGSYEEEGIILGVAYVARKQADPEEWFDWNNELPQLTLLKPGNKLYVYAYAVFDERATSLPSKNNFSHTLNFNFYTEQYVDENIGLSAHLSDIIFRKNSIVSSGTGLYSEIAYDSYGDEYDLYTFRSDAATNVNNYVKIDGKMWRIMDFTVNRLDGDQYTLVEDDDTINSNTVFSTVVGEDGFYNNYETSTLYDTIIAFYLDQVNNKDIIFYDTIRGIDNGYVENTEVFDYVEYSYSQPLPTVTRIMKASTDSSCSFATLSTGGCQSWLTNNGDTYLFNKVFESDKTTNTGKIAYLQNGKVIAVNPNDTNYGHYKMTLQINDLCDPLVTNADVADGSKQNPYILSIAPEDMCGLPE